MKKQENKKVLGLLNTYADMPLRARPSSYSGSLIVLEGMDGAGKSTLAEKLREKMEQSGATVRVVRTPGGTDIGEKLRDILLTHTGDDIDITTEAFLFQAQLSACIQQVIIPSLTRGDVVICDRLVLSTFAYQGAGRGFPLDILWNMQEVSLEGVWPDIIFLLKNKPKTETDGTRMEEAGPEFTERVATYYDNLLDTNEMASEWIIPILVDEDPDNTIEDMVRKTGAKLITKKVER